MGLFDKLFRKDGADNAKDAELPVAQRGNIVLASTSHIVKDDFLKYVTSYKISASLKYVASYKINASFKPAKSHAGEVELLSTYAPNEEYGSEGSIPYVAVQEDDVIFDAISEFEKSGTFEGAVEVHALSGKYLFRAKTEYFGDMMYFYGFTHEEGYWDKAGLCMVYPKEYVGTDNEKKLMQVLDEAAQSFEEIKVK